MEGAGISARQQGVFRVNCIDCLDRTNVVQGVLARHHLEFLLRRLQLLSDSASLPGTFPKAEPYSASHTLSPMLTQQGFRQDPVFAHSYRV